MSQEPIPSPEVSGATHSRRPPFHLIRSKDQRVMMLPVIGMLAFSFGVCYFLFHQLSSEAAEVMRLNGVPGVVMSRYLDDSQRLLLVCWTYAAVLGLIGFLWVWNISHRLIGPFVRISRELKGIVDGSFPPEKLTVREKDFLFPLVNLVREALLTMRDRGRS